MAFIALRQITNNPSTQSLYTHLFSFPTTVCIQFLNFHSLIHSQLLYVFISIFINSLVFLDLFPLSLLIYWSETKGLTTTLLLVVWAGTFLSSTQYTFFYSTYILHLLHSNTFHVLYLNISSPNMKVFIFHIF